MAGYNAMKGKRYLRTFCGFCDKQVAVNVDGRLRRHTGIESGEECPASGETLRPVVGVDFALTEADGSGESIEKVSLCVVCGLWTNEEANHADFTKRHNHRRPRVTRERDLYVVTWFSYTKAQWRRVYRDTHADAMSFAEGIRER